ncbi:MULTISPECIES: PTS sugar transporter subunit IIB [Bacillus]|uniref:PTS lactose transporter subunit IIB n=1 Tax=Bacillus pumilus TaxID=1408 RepID=A0A2G8IQQ8_BACPU|nr:MULTISPECIES: PTS sugar transporter subunit IIB [Bacillus]MCC9087360.1 PTS sugar transporter subunit IIB [Bacillus pumilus]MED1749171.1 PTS sugar transporter subunit IIB [Bacillus zhangzhouensis]PIK25821.1 PTS lactose transporter subunit IIB [Bacillus pumilus]UUD44351.1 PTS sugar transporter subunit IIB [Bacillus pumilus]
MKKILVVCGNGLGSSFIVEMNVKKALEELGLLAKVDHTDLSTSKNEKADLYIGAKDIIDQLDDGTRKVAGLNNLLDQESIKDVLRKHI